MRWIATILALSALIGCAAKPQAVRHASAPLTRGALVYEDAIAVSALVFDPPIASNEAPLDLSRDVRERTAFVGYDQLTTTFFYVRSDDKQRFDNFNTGDRFERRAVSERFGVSFR